ncbi:MAG: hypothetical protein GTO14_08990 [Anaerolineales bacterium]|nr:hypothetical protein [Anaerolineales bacterium]
MKGIRRFRSPALPTTQPGRVARLVLSLERSVKGWLFQCGMCGNCILQETAYICPMLCPKGLRNGPCGSGATDHCCVDPDRPCIWHLIYHRAEAAGQLDRLLEVQAPLDWDKAGHSTWIDAVKIARGRHLISLIRMLFDDKWGEDVLQLFHDLRQSEWWKGDNK